MRKSALKRSFPPIVKRTLREIYDYTSDTWGMDKAAAYHQDFKKAFALLTQNPEAGHAHSDIPSNYLCYLVGRHIIIYRVDKEYLYIVAILHQQMDIANRISNILNQPHYH